MFITAQVSRSVALKSNPPNEDQDSTKRCDNYDIVVYVHVYNYVCMYELIYVYVVMYYCNVWLYVCITA